MVDVHDKHFSHIYLQAEYLLFWCVVDERQKGPRLLFVVRNLPKDPATAKC